MQKIIYLTNIKYILIYFSYCICSDFFPQMLFKFNKNKELHKVSFLAIYKT